MDKVSISEERLKYLQLLSERYQNIREVSTEMINLQAILNLPKGTEHFLSDVHGEYESFIHVLRNASGVIKSYLNELFANTMMEAEIRSLATLVYYPKEKLAIVKKSEENLDDWYRITLFRLVALCKRTSSKYTRSKVRKALNKNFAYIMEELIHEDGSALNKQEYYNQIIETIIKVGRADDYIIEICHLIQKLSIDRLHIIGDIFDRGPGPDKILDELIKHENYDIQWGNHDILWMGAAAGSFACILNVLRISARYGHLHTLEDGYGINLVPLVTYALEHYGGSDCTRFKPKIAKAESVSEKEERMIAEIHKAVCVLQFKVEGILIKRHPEYLMDDRLSLDQIDYNEGTITIDGKVHRLLDSFFPTIDSAEPYKLTDEEITILEKLETAFQNSPKLQMHTRLLFAKGSMYSVFNSNLLFHGCVPMNDDGSFKKVKIDNQYYMGKELLDALEIKVREGYLKFSDPHSMLQGQDRMWYLWCGPDSPLFGKNRMTTFERYFIEDKATYEEQKDPYYLLRGQEDICIDILKEFGLSKNAHIINGHVPVKVIKGESPIKAGGRLLVIDGGFAKAYQKETGIAGYTLIFNSHGLVLASHEPFESTQRAIEEELDIHSHKHLLEYTNHVIRVGDTDTGAKLKESIQNLRELLYAYETGKLKETI